MDKNNNPFEGVNKVCAQCIHDCKQFENVVLMNCPKFHSIRVQTPLSSSYARRTRIKNKGAKSGS